MKFVPHIHHTKVSSKEAVVQDNKANNYSNSSVHSSLMLEQNRLEQKSHFKGVGSGAQWILSVWEGFRSLLVLIGLKEITWNVKYAFGWGERVRLNYIKKYCSFPLPSTAKLQGAQTGWHILINELQNSRTELFLSFESWNVQDPGAGWGRKWWLWFWQSPSSWSRTGAVPRVLGVLEQLSLHRYSQSRTRGLCCGVGKEEWKDRTLSPLCSCSVLLQFLSGCLPSLSQSLQVSLGWCVPLCHGFPSEGKPHNKNLFFQLLKAELSGHLYPVIPAP